MPQCTATYHSHCTHSAILHAEPHDPIRCDCDSVCAVIVALYTVSVALYTVIVTLYTVIVALHTVIVPLYAVIGPLYTVIVPLYAVIVPVYTVIVPLCTVIEAVTAACCRRSSGSASGPSVPAAFNSSLQRCWGSSQAEQPAAPHQNETPFAGTSRPNK